MSNMHYAALFQGKFMFSSCRCIKNVALPLECFLSKHEMSSEKN